MKEKEKIIGLFQSCFYLKNFQTKEREIKSLLKASKELNCENLWIINQDYGRRNNKREENKIYFFGLVFVKRQRRFSLKIKELTN